MSENNQEILSTDDNPIETPIPEAPLQSGHAGSDEAILALPEEPLLEVDSDLVSPVSLASSEESPAKLEVPEIDALQETVQSEPIVEAAGMEEVESPQTPPTPTEPAYSPPPPTPPPATGASPDSEERTWASLSHLSILLNLFTGFLGPIAALIIYLVYKDKSRYVAYQAMQAFVFQLVWWVGAGVVIAIAWIMTGLLSIVIIGLCLIPIAIVISFVPFAALIYAVIAAVKTNQGEDFRYWLIGDWVRGTLTGN